MIIPEITMVAFDGSQADVFKQLNLQWIKKYFTVEPEDEMVLSNPEKEIIQKGGYIFFAMAEGEIAGTFALLKVTDEIYELGKMAVDPRWQGKQVGNAMVAFCLQKAKDINAKKVILYSNTILQPAIHLYKKFGFVEVPLSAVTFKRSNIKMEIDLN